MSKKLLTQPMDREEFTLRIDRKLLTHKIDPRLKTLSSCKTPTQEHTDNIEDKDKIASML